MYKPLTDQQWQQIEPLFPKVLKRGRGKPHTSWRIVVNSILMVFLAQEKWSAIPISPEFATKSVSHRWFAIWDKNGFLNELLKAYQAACQGGVELTVPPRRKRVPKSAKVDFSITVEDDSSLMDEMPAYAVPQEAERQEISV
jgi:transposase